jgi:proline dehydrogenase
MRVWQQGMIVLARSQRVQLFMQDRSALTRLAERFVGGADAAEAVTKALELKKKGMRASLYYLGEYVRDPRIIAHTLKTLGQAAGGLADAGLDHHLSVDPTQIGLLDSQTAACQNLLTLGSIVDRAASTDGSCRCNWVMLDMEDHSVVDATLSLCRSLKEAGLPVAITLQAYLYRTQKDLNRLVEQRTPVRLVKGAFAESRQVAWTNRAEISANYLQLAHNLISRQAREQGVYPIFATHDHILIGQLLDRVRSEGLSPREFEFEMLFGVRPDLQQRFTKEGWRVRLYLPFGRDWWPYAIRRVGENIRNAAFLAQALVR